MTVEECWRLDDCSSMSRYELFGLCIVLPCFSCATLQCLRGLVCWFQSILLHVGWRRCKWPHTAFFGGLSPTIVFPCLRGLYSAISARCLHISLVFFLWHMIWAEVLQWEPQPLRQSVFVLDSQERADALSKLQAEVRQMDQAHWAIKQSERDIKGQTGQTCSKLNPARKFEGSHVIILIIG